MDNKFFIIFFLFILINVNFIVAAPPQTPVFEKGLTLEYPQYQSIKQNEDFEIHTHVFNTSDGAFLTGTDATCYLHLYNTTGDHTCKSKYTFNAANMFDYELEITAGNFSDIGTHAYIIQCNNTINQGGFDSGTFIVTKTGELYTASDFLIIVSFFIMTIVLMLLGYLFSNSHWLLKLFFNIMGIFTMIVAANGANIFITNQLVSSLSRIGIIGLIVTITTLSFFLLYTFIHIFIEIIKSIEEKKGVRWNYETPK